MNVERCTRCPLSQGRKQIVNGRGPVPARLMLVGEGPGRNEDELGKPFVGRAGRVLSYSLREAGIDEEEVRITNSVRCRPPGNRKPKKDELAACYSHLVREIEATSPAVIVALGDTANRVLTDGYGPLGQLVETEIGTWRGLVLHTYHPAYLLRGQWQALPLLVLHLAKAVRAADGKFVPDKELHEYTIETLPELRMLKQLLTGPDIDLIAIDTETTGGDVRTRELLCISFSYIRKGKPGNEGFTVPLRINSPDGLVPYWKDDEPEALACIRGILESDRPKAIQFGFFDLPLLRRERGGAITAETAYGFAVKNIVHDPVLASRLLLEGAPADERHLIALHTTMPDYEQNIRKETDNKRRMERANPETLWFYAAADADALARIVHRLGPKIEKDQDSSWVYRNISLPMLECCTAMTLRGVLVDKDWFDRLAAEIRDRISAKEEELFRLSGTVFNPRSVQQVRTLLYETLGLQPTKRRTKGAVECGECEEGVCARHLSTDIEALQELAGRSEVARQLIELRKLERIRSTYLDGLSGTGGLLAHIADDGRIHAEYKVGGTETGRLSSSNPNMQNIPREFPALNHPDAIRRLFIAPPGYVWMDADWSNGEVWVIAYESGDERLLSLLEAGIDVHTFVARELGKLGGTVFPNVDPDLPDPEWKSAHSDLRARAKTVVFGFNYGLSVQGLQSRFGCSEKEAEAIIEAYTQRIFPGLSDYQQRITEAVRRTGVLKAWSGRTRRFYALDMLWANGWNEEAGHLIREALNLPIQAGLSDLHSLAHIETERNMPELRIVNAVHDSLSAEVEDRGEDYLIEVAWRLKELWEKIARDTIRPDGKRLGWRIPVEVSWGPSWGEKKYAILANGTLIEKDSTGTFRLKDGGDDGEEDASLF